MDEITMDMNMINENLSSNANADDSNLEREVFQTPLNSPIEYELEEAEAAASIAGIGGTMDVDSKDDGDLFSTPSLLTDPERRNHNDDNISNTLLTNAMMDANLTDSFLAEMPLNSSPATPSVLTTESLKHDEQSTNIDIDLLTLQANMNEKFATLTEQLKTNFRDFDNRITKLESFRDELKQSQDLSAQTLSSLSSSSLLQEESLGKIRTQVNILSERLKLIDDGKVESFVKKIVRANIPSPPPPPAATFDEHRVKQIVLQHIPPPPPPPTPFKLDEKLFQKRIEEAVASKVQQLTQIQHPQPHQQQFKRPQQMDVKLKTSASRPSDSDRGSLCTAMSDNTNNVTKNQNGLSTAFHHQAAKNTFNDYNRNPIATSFTRNDDTDLNNNIINNNINNNEWDSSNVKGIQNSTMNTNIDCDLLIIGDSNAQKIDPNKMGRCVCQLLWAPQIKDAVELIKNLNLVQPPRYVLLNVGLNDLHKPLLQSTNNIDELVLATKAKFPPTTNVFINSILHRGDERYLNQTDELNQYINSKCVGNIRFVNHHNIDHNENMEDHLHLDKVGLHIFVSNIKFGVLGILPNTSKQRGRPHPRSSFYRTSSGRGGPSQGFGNGRNGGPGGRGSKRFNPPRRGGYDDGRRQKQNYGRRQDGHGSGNDNHRYGYDNYDPDY